MKKNELKQILKPMIKECVREALYEEGLLSNVVAEVVKGMKTAPLNESKTYAPPAPPTPSETEASEEAAAIRAKSRETRRQLMEAIGKDAYNGIDLFEGTSALTNHEAAEPRAGSVDLGDPRDEGVDISSIMGGATRMWRAMK